MLMTHKPVIMVKLHLLAHESYTPRQCEQFNGAEKFGHHYFSEFEKGGSKFLRK